MKINITNRHVVMVSETDYFNNTTHRWLHNTEAIFCTERTDFGGFSYAFIHTLTEKLLFTSAPATVEWEETILPLAPASLYLIKTPITQEAAEAYQLMLKILAVCRDNRFKTVRITPFVHLTSNQRDTFEAIADALLTYRNQYRNALVHPCNLLFDVAPGHYNVFCDVMNTKLMPPNRRTADNY